MMSMSERVGLCDTCLRGGLDAPLGGDALASVSPSEEKCNKPWLSVHCFHFVRMLMSVSHRLHMKESLEFWEVERAANQRAALAKDVRFHYLTLRIQHSSYHLQNPLLLGPVLHLRCQVLLHSLRHPPQRVVSTAAQVGRSRHAHTNVYEPRRHHAA